MRGDIDMRQHLNNICRDIARFVMGWRIIDNSSWLKVVNESIRQSTSYEALFFQDWLEVELYKILPIVQFCLRLFDVTLPSEVELLICEFAFV